MKAYQNIEIDPVVLVVTLSDPESLGSAYAARRRRHTHRSLSGEVGFRHLARNHQRWPCFL